MKFIFYMLMCIAVTGCGVGLCSLRTNCSPSTGVVFVSPSGVIDTSFGVAGKATRLNGTGDDIAYGATVQSDGKILVGGQVFVGINNIAAERFTANGVFDTTFGVGGYALQPLTAWGALGKAIALQSDGKILVIGEIVNAPNINSLAVRFLSNGTLDTTYGTAGVFQDPANLNFYGRSAKLLSNGKVLTTQQDPSNSNDFSVLQVLSSGLIDTSFGTAGNAAYNFGSNDIANGFDIQSDGKIVLVGQSCNFSVDFGAIRLSSAGVLDTTFGTGGSTRVDYAALTDAARGVVILGNGKMVLGGFVTNANQDFGVLGLTANGLVDTTFGTSGWTVTNFGAGDDYIAAMALQPDGKILAVGSATIGAQKDFAIARYTATGALDTSFGTAGRMTIDFSGQDDEINGIYLYPSGKILVVGYATIGGIKYFAMARIQ